MQSSPVDQDAREYRAEQAIRAGICLGAAAQSVSAFSLEGFGCSTCAATGRRQSSNGADTCASKARLANQSEREYVTARWSTRKPTRS